MTETTETIAPPLHTIETDDGLKLAYRELGSGPAVLLLHGWPTSSYLWRGVMPAIARRNRVLALDLPGFGASDKPLGAGYGFGFFERAIDDFLAAMGETAVSLGGHDIGGPIALHWTLARPERVTRLALLNPLVYPEFSPAVLEFVKALTTPAERDRITSPEGLAEVMRTGVAADEHMSAELAAAVAEPFASPESRLALAQAGIGVEPGRFAELAQGLPQLRIPVRVVYGEQDRILPDIAETVARLGRDLPRVEITALPAAGHFLQEEAPAEVGELLADFFAPD